MIFPADEFRQRASRINANLAQSGFDALFLTGPADIFYVTGFLTRFWESPTRPWFVIVPVGGEPVAVIPGIGAALMGQTWVSDIRTWDAPDLEDDGISLLVETLQEHLPPSGRIALPMGHESHLRMPLGDFERVRTALAPRTFGDGTAIIRDARMVKSDPEVQTIRIASAIADRAFERVGEIARDGVPLEDVFRNFQRLLLEEGADWVTYLAGAAGQDGYSDVISPATVAPLISGDILMLDTGAVKNGYHCDFDRNWAVGQPSVAARRTYDLLWQATEAGLNAARPGATAADLYTAMVGVLGETCVPGRLGHGLGLNLTEPPSLIPTDTTVLREGMVLTLEPCAWVTDTRLMVAEENIVIRADGPELLTRRAPPELPVL